MESFYALHPPSTLIGRAKWPTIRKHRTSIAGAVDYVVVEVGTDAEPQCVNWNAAERIQPISVSWKENALAIVGLEKNTFHAVSSSPFVRGVELA